MLFEKPKNEELTVESIEDNTVEDSTEVTDADLKAWQGGERNPALKAKISAWLEVGKKKGEEKMVKAMDEANKILEEYKAKLAEAEARLTEARAKRDSIVSSPENPHWKIDSDTAKLKVQEAEERIRGFKEKLIPEQEKEIARLEGIDRSGAYGLI